MPSIMPLGATMSAPARAWLTATRPRISRVASLSTVSPRSTPQWPWLVYSQQQTSVMSSRSGWRSRSRRSARWTMPSSAKFSVPTSSFAAGRPKSMHRRNAERLDPIHLAVERLVHRQVADARHRVDLALDPLAVDHEDGLDEVAGSQLVLAHQPAQGLGAAAAAGTLDREWGSRG